MWLVGVVSRKRVWLVGVGEISTGCGCKEVYRIPHTTYPYSFCICSFLQQHSYFLFIFLMVFNIIESVDSISRDERDVPLTQYITTAGIIALGTLSRILNTTDVFYKVDFQSN